MANLFKARLSKTQKGADTTSDIAVLQTQLMLSKMWLTFPQNETDRIKKFININDSLDALESLIVGKINLGMKEWIVEHNEVRRQLLDYNMPYYNIERFRELVKRRYNLYNIVLQSLGYYTKEIVRNDSYDAQMGEDLIISGL